MALVESDTPLVSSPVPGHPMVRGQRPAALRDGLACSERLPRDALVRLTVLLRQVGHIREGQAPRSEVSLRLADVAAGLEALIQSIHDETALHLTGRPG